MNRLEGHRTIGSSFYKNVFLLTQMQPPCVEFQRYFRQGMFDKPNTAGFLHISHYLSNLYDAALFKQMVRWPTLCKRDEVTYRIEMKNFLSILSRDNSDVNFPPILMSHLIQSGGTKFLIIMWKLSQVALRTYIKREFQGELWNAPCPSLMDHLAIAYFSNVIAKKHSIIIETHKEIQKIHDTATTFLNNEIEILNVYKLEIFDRKENIEKLVLNTSVHQLIQKRLIDVEDVNIISLWKRSILEKMQYIYKKNKELNKLRESCDYLCKLVLRISTNSGSLDAKKLPKINCNNFLLQHTINNLYADNSIISFSTLLTLLYLTSVQMLFHINAADFSDLSPCLLFVQNICKEIKFLHMLFIALNIRINSIVRDEQCDSRKNENAYSNSDINNKLLLTANYRICLQSPKINFNFNKCVDDNLFYEKLWSSLKAGAMKGKHKDLFKRYAGKYRPSHELSTALSDFSNSWNSMSGWLSPRARSTKCVQILSNGKPLSPLYSRLLQRSKLNLKRSRENLLYSSSTSYEGLNLTPRKRRSTSEQIIKNKCDGRARDLFNSAATSSLSCVSSNSEN
ncbi:uncharacterized protein LOC115240565 isoform X2 [Formica exsecta]|uniref:uncharacterized protein LOC115240565 isoform X2 n=1 Tax=Formica exsecta TaxID=72781 RepID=UPI0011441B5B|nr:uncharacterized protein LOC115240565 isoform X2 [Formica exsecta]